MARFGERHCKYVKWTDVEIGMLREGRMPPGRSVNQCRCKAASIGVEFRTPGSNRWTPEEIGMVSSGQIPPGRTIEAAVAYCLQHRLAIPKGARRPDARINDWSPEAVDRVANDVVPPGRTVTACRFMAKTMLGKGFTPDHARRHREMLERGRRYLEAHESGRTYADIGAEEGISRQRVQQIALAYRRTIK